MIVLDARFHLLSRSLQVLSNLKTDPYFQHGCVALTYALEERSAAALGTELAQDWESAAEGVSTQMEMEMDGMGWDGCAGLPLEQIEVRIETSPDSLEKENADDHVDEVTFHAHVMAADHA